MQSNNTQTLKVSTLWAVSLSVFMFPFMISAVNIALPAIQSEFAVDAVLLSWTATAYLLASGVVLVPAGKLGDIYGRKKIFVIGIAICTIFTVGTAFVPSIYWIIVFRILQGVGAAMSMATSMAIISDVFPIKERGKAMGIVVACVYIGYSFGPFAGGWITSLLGWRGVFLINAPFGILALYLSIAKITQEWAHAENECFDITGSVLYGISLVCIMLGFTSLSTILGTFLLCLGIAGCIVFIYYTAKTQFPIIDLSLFRNNRTFTFSSIAALINYSATYAVAFLLSLYLQYIQGMTPQMAGVVLVSQPLVQAIFSPYAGKLSDKANPAIIASVGMALTVLGLFLLIFLDDETSIPYIIASLLTLGLGFALFSSPNMNAIMSSVEKKLYGVASGTVATMRLLGQVISMAIVTFLFSLILGNKEITPENYNAFLYSTNILFVIFTISCLAGIFFSLTRGITKKV